jgi:integrase
VLTDAKVRAAKPGAKQIVLTDTDGLELLISPSGAKLWRLRYQTETGARKRVTLGKYPDVGIAQARREASKLRAQVWTGADPVEERKARRVAGITVAELVEQYVAEHQPAWKASTASTYLSSIKRFVAWAESAGVEGVDQLSPDALARYRAHSIALTRKVKAKGGSRRDTVDTGERRSAAAINGDLRCIKTMLSNLRRAGRLTAIGSSDDIADTLRLVATERARPDPLKADEIRRLLGAALEHDAATYAITRVEAAGQREVGTTQRFDAIAPLVLLMLLSGMRLGEALALLGGLAGARGAAAGSPRTGARGRGRGPELGAGRGGAASADR